MTLQLLLETPALRALRIIVFMVVGIIGVGMPIVQTVNAQMSALEALRAEQIKDQLKDIASRVAAAEKAIADHERRITIVEVNQANDPWAKAAAAIAGLLAIDRGAYYMRRKPKRGPAPEDEET